MENTAPAEADDRAGLRPWGDLALKGSGRAEAMQLEFHVGQLARQPYTVFLSHDSWDDFSFQTLFHVTYCDGGGDMHALGSVKIGEYGLRSAPRGSWAPGYRSPALPARFWHLEAAQHFSLGQDPRYYEWVNAMGPEFRVAYLTAMNDIAFDRSIRESAFGESVTQMSLLRTVSARTVADQFERLASGGDATVSYDLSFPVRDKADAVSLRCTVAPNTMPPENIQVLIGRNGVGKSTTLHEIARMLIVGAREPLIEERIREQRSQLANLVSVTFSAFDEFEPIPDNRGADGLIYHYVGLKELEVPTADVGQKNSGGQSIAGPTNREAGQAPVIWRPRTSRQLDTETVEATKECLAVEERRERLARALQFLDKDPNFAEFGVTGIVLTATPDDIELALLPVLGKMSSGHRIVLLTVTKLVETVAEKTLVLMDEPEAHLHPPLLSALLRALSDLLADRNGLAVVATHSPVVLQEVPRSCVNIVEKDNHEISLHEPQLETFGENVGTLTGEVFGLDVPDTGFHDMIRQVVEEVDDYKAGLDKFGGHLGAEARALLRSMIAAKAAQGRDVGR
ncbi:AAA family ATPase [Mycobacteroides abscessus]|uniref:AAA family ATPase n=1 Tax=Mycobacteroides abscessus TaxID=36809 RepID=UPI001054A03A|nr:AAA family ATPase [Mycobacteroides abscessus]